MDKKDDIIRKYFQGESLDHLEKEQLSQWKQNAETNAELDAMFKVWQATGNIRFRYSPDLNKQWDILTETTENKVIPFSRRYVAIAASMAFLFLFSWLGYSILSDSDVKISSGPDEIKEHFLPDGSTVWLNESSTIFYPVDFASDKRVVNGDGELFFEVRRNESKPFIVRTAHAEVKVLGTRFNVNTRKNGTKIEVAVQSGKVSVAPKDSKVSSILLSKGEIAALTVESNDWVKTSGHSSNHLAWKTQELIFYEESMSVVLEQLASYFGVTMQVSNKNIKNCLFTSSFSNPTLKEVLDAITLSLELEYTIIDKTIRFTGNGCNP
jgi:ferric-dicitrate binding protein FerR (iron transport regulator)